MIIRLPRGGLATGTRDGLVDPEQAQQLRTAYLNQFRMHGRARRSASPGVAAQARPQPDMGEMFRQALADAAAAAFLAAVDDARRQGPGW